MVMLRILMLKTLPVGPPGNVKRTPNRGRFHVLRLMRSAWSSSGLVLLHQERERNHNPTSDGKYKDDIVVGQSCSLLLHAAINQAIGALRSVGSTVASARHRLSYGAELVLKSLACCSEMRREVALVLLRTLRQQGFDDRYSDTSAHISRQVHHARNLIVFVARHAYIRHRVDRNEQTRNSGRLKNAEFNRFA